MDTQDQIKAIEEEIRKTPYHKGTERHIGVLRARLALLKDRQIEKQSRKSGGGGGGYAVKKQGDATLVLVGPPSAGKSTLLNALTNAESKVAPYAFTTVSVIPGMMKYKNAYIQILDVPGLIEGAEEGKGRGREVISVVRGADLLLLMTDVDRPQALTRIYDALERNGIRLNKERPKIRIEKRLNGGINIQTNIKQSLERETILEVITQMGVKNADIYLEENVNIDTLLDALSRNRVFMPYINVVNKSENISLEKRAFYEKEFNPSFISAESNLGLSELRERIWETLGLSTIYLVEPLEAPNENHPIVVKAHMCLSEIAQKIGSEFYGTKTKAKIWGNGAKFPGQEVSLKSKICDGMMVRFI